MKKEYQVGDLVCLKEARTQEVFTVTRVVSLISLPMCATPSNNKVPFKVECGHRSFWINELEPKPITVGDMVRSVWEVDFDTYEVMRVEVQAGDEVMDLFSKALNCTYKDTSKYFYRAVSTEPVQVEPEPAEKNTSPLSFKLTELRSELDRIEAEPRGVGSTVYPVIAGAHDKIRALLDLAESLVEINLTETHDDPDKGIYETLTSVLNLRGDRWDGLR